MSVSIFLPVRKASVRVLQKSTRPFADFQGGLLELKLQQLIKTRSVDEILLSTNDERAMEIGEHFRKRDARVNIKVRPEELASSETDLSDLIAHAADIVSSDHILWTHVTSPFCDEHIYEEAIRIYLEKINENYDSLVTVHKFQNFLWDKEARDIINRQGSRRWPNTQDLRSFYEINNAIFLARRSTYFKQRDRLGTDPFLYELKKIPSLDIDEEEDFTIAEAVYERDRR